MSGRTEEHLAWNTNKGLQAGSQLVLHCPRCQTLHEETLTNDPKQEDYMHHVHQCHACGLRFDLFVRCRGIPGGHSIDLSGNLVLAGHRVGVQVGAHEVLYLDALLRGLVGKDVEIRVVEKK